MGEKREPISLAAIAMKKMVRQTPDQWLQSQLATWREANGRSLNSQDAEYWQLSEEYKARCQREIDGRKQQLAREESERVRTERVESSPNLCRVCGEVIPPTGKRGRPAVKCRECREKESK